jgi:hypothetical protein
MSACGLQARRNERDSDGKTVAARPCRRASVHNGVAPAVRTGNLPPRRAKRGLRSAVARVGGVIVGGGPRVHSGAQLDAPSVSAGDNPVRPPFRFEPATGTTREQQQEAAQYILQRVRELHRELRGWTGRVRGDAAECDWRNRTRMSGVGARRAPAGANAAEPRLQPYFSFVADGATRPPLPLRSAAASEQQSTSARACRRRGRLFVKPALSDL